MDTSDEARPVGRHEPPRMPFISHEEELRVTGLAQRYGYDNAEHLCFDWLEDLHEMAIDYRPPAVAARPWQATLRAWLEERARYPGNNAMIVAKRAARGEAAPAVQPVPVSLALEPAVLTALAALAAGHGLTVERLLERLLADLARAAAGERGSGPSAHLAAWAASITPAP